MECDPKNHNGPRLLPKKEHSYDVVTGNSIFTLGTSLGSINAFIMGMYPLGEEAKATQDLEKFWSGLNSDKLYNDWKLWITEGLFMRSGFYNTEPLKEILKNFDKE